MTGKTDQHRCEVCFRMHVPAPCCAGCSCGVTEPPRLTHRQALLLARLPRSTTEGRRCEGAERRAAEALAERGFACRLSDGRYVRTRVGGNVVLDVSRRIFGALEGVKA